MSGQVQELPAPGVFFEINTFEPLHTDGAAVAQWLEEARRALVEPLIETVAPAGRAVTLSWTTIAGADHVERPFSAKRWDQLLTLMSEGGIGRVVLLMQQLSDRGFVSHKLPPIKLEVELEGLEYEGAAHRVSFVAGRPLYGPVLGRDQQELLVTMAKRAALQFRACSGYVTVDYAGRESPYELSIGRIFVWALRECAEFLRGYYWGNFLSARHVERLGGPAAIRRDAPCVLVEELSSDPMLVYLQLSDDLDSFSDEQLRELWSYLHPVLPQTERVPSDTGWPMRIVHGQTG